MDKSENGETKVFVQKVVWGVLTGAVGLTFLLVGYIYNSTVGNVERAIMEIKADVNLIEKSLGLMREEGIIRAQRTARIEEKITTVEKQMVRFERQYRVRFGYDVDEK